MRLRRELMGEFLYWFFAGFVVELIKVRCLLSPLLPSSPSSHSHLRREGALRMGTNES